jgi:hypothetical protein
MWYWGARSGGQCGAHLLGLQARRSCGLNWRLQRVFYYSSDLGATGICANNIKTLAMILRHGPVANYTLGAA